MPDLNESLQGRDLGHLRIVAEFWGIELDVPDARSGLPVLVKVMLDPHVAAEIVNDLPGEVRAALQDLAQGDGRMPWALFTRRYGEVREMGAGRRDREQPYLDPVSAAEMLWYYGLIARAFFDTPEGVEEFVYIPEDLLTCLPRANNQNPAVLGRAAYAAECAFKMPVSDRLLDHACTLLAALRSGQPAPDEYVFPTPACVLSAAALQLMLVSVGILDETMQPIPEAARSFLEAGRGEALAVLTKAWLKSDSFNELRLLPGLNPEGNWKNDPLHTRQVVLNFISSLPKEQWWNLESLVAAVREQQPDFQRRGGDYDTWFIRSLDTGEFLRGFEHWDEVEGALLRFFIAGPLYWLGIVELASAQEDGRVTAFRHSALAEALLSGETPSGLPNEEAKLIIRSDAHLYVPRLVPRAIRYQVARFCEWDRETTDGYDYHLTPASLTRAKQQGLGVQHLLSLLRKSGEAIPPSLVKALERWEAHGSAARLETVSVLRFNSPEVLQALRSSRAARFLGDPLGPASITVKSGAEQKVLAILAELGFLGEIKAG
jgi:hypothetical protein